MMINKSQAWLLGLVCVCLTNQAAADFVLVDSETAPCPIVIAAQASTPEIRLAENLADYLQKISGQKFEITRAEAKLPPRALQLLIDPDADLSAEASQWECDDQLLIIRASSQRGLAYGVYAFLEQKCGCKWWSHNEELIPEAKSLHIKNGKTTHQAAFAMHDIFSREAQSRENDFYLKSGADSQLQFTSGHSLYPLLTPYAKEHPEIFPANKDGKRAGNDLHFCYLAPGISEALTTALEAEVKQRNGNVEDFIYFAGMGDWYGGQCQCEKCKAVYEEEAWTNPDGQRIPGYTATLLRMINKTAADLEKKYPGIQVGTFAYMSLEAPPAVTKPRANVSIRVPRLRHCTVHAANECEKNRAFYHNLMRWEELAPGRVHVWEYGVNFKNFMLPFPSLKSMAENLKFYHQLGINGVMIQGNYVSTGGDAVVLKNYVWRKLLWNPELSLDDLTAEFCQGYYGPAAEHVQNYLQTLESAVRSSKPIHADEFASPHNTYLTPELIAELQNTLVSALKITSSSSNPDFERRVRELMVSVETAELWKSGPLEEKEGALVRTDLGENTFERAQQLVKHCRNGSPVEWGIGRSYQLNFLRMHGGPIATLESKPLALKIAPVQGGRIGPVTYADQVVIEKLSVEPAGGVILYEFEKTPTRSEARMTGECGIGSWTPTPQHIASLSLKLKNKNQIQMQESLQRIGKASATANSNVTTSYPLSKLSAAKIGWQDVSGKWTEVELTTEKPSLTCVGLTALRIELSEPKLQVLDTYSRVEKNLDDLLNDVGDSAAPTGHYGVFKFDPKTSQLITTVRVTADNISAEEPTLAVDRTLEISAQK